MQLTHKAHADNIGHPDDPHYVVLNRDDYPAIDAGMIDRFLDKPGRFRNKIQRSILWEPNGVSVNAHEIAVCLDFIPTQAEIDQAIAWLIDNYEEVIQS